jgi:hypothetical protein
MESNSSPNVLIKTVALASYKNPSFGATPPSPRPSRHLLIPRAAASPRKTPPPSPAITLLDKYEIEWITTQLKRLISSSSVPHSSEESGDRRKVEKKKSCRMGFGFGSSFGRHATSLCGSIREAAAETTSKSGAKPR